MKGEERREGLWSQSQGEKSRHAYLEFTGDAVAPARREETRGEEAGRQGSGEASGRRGGEA